MRLLHEIVPAGGFVLGRATLNIAVGVITRFWIRERPGIPAAEGLVSRTKAVHRRGETG